MPESLLGVFERAEKRFERESEVDLGCYAAAAKGSTCLPRSAREPVRMLVKRTVGIDFHIEAYISPRSMAASLAPTVLTITNGLLHAVCRARSVSDCQSS